MDYIIHNIHACPSCPYIETSNILGHLGFEIKIRFHEQISSSKWENMKFWTLQV